MVDRQPAKSRWHLLRFVPTVIGAGILAMTQVGSKQAEANFCSYVAPTNDTCLHGLISVEIMQALAVMLVVGGIGWFLWSPVTNLVKNHWRFRAWRYRTRTRIRRVPMWPLVGVLVGGLLFVGCTAWVLFKISVANNDTQTALTRYVLPRHLSQQQMDIISTYLQQHQPFSVKLRTIAMNSEASGYGSDIQKALKSGGLIVDFEGYKNDIQQGIRIRSVVPQNYQHSHALPPHEILRKAFDAAGVKTHGSGSASGGSITEYSVELSIGSRRMDDSDIRARKRGEEEARNILAGGDTSYLGY